MNRDDVGRSVGAGRDHVIELGGTWHDAGSGGAVPRDPAAAPDVADVLELGTPRDGGPPRPRWRRVLPLALAAGLLVTAVVFQAERGDDDNPAVAPAPSAVTVSPPRAARTSASVPPGPVVTEIGGPLLEVTAGWELFASGPNAVIRIDLAHGRVTSTALEPVGSSGPMSFVVGRDWAIIRPLDAVPGYLVPDGRPAVRLTGALGVNGPALPGPDLATVWAPASDPEGKMILVDPTGRATGPSITLPPDAAWSVQPDGTGYLLFNGTGGVYSARPDSMRRITTGVLLAAGPTRWLAMECDEWYRCGPVVIDRATGSRRTLRATLTSADSSGGVISPDGRTAALPVMVMGGNGAIDLVDLGSGAVRRIDISVASTDAGAMVWSPDGRWLFVVGANKWLYAVDAVKGLVNGLGAEIPPISLLAVRPAGS